MPNTDASVADSFPSHKSRFFFEIKFSKISFRNIIRVSNSLDPDQARCFVGSDLGPNFLQKLEIYYQTALVDKDLISQKQFNNILCIELFYNKL